MSEKTANKTSITGSEGPIQDVSEQWGFQRLLGMRIVEWCEGYAVVELSVSEQHLNRSGMAHGGVLTSLLDTALSLSGLHCPVPGNVRKGMTLSLTTTFIAPARGGVLRAEGRRRGGGRATYMASGEVLDADGNVIAMGEGAFRVRSASQSPEGEPA
ncbi:PaaI family thioesterase [Salinicola salarius]|uniref:PaaI family thioesterase n=1 Tax=Salinicola salarius TaxID=430457 RepID=UPI000B3FFED3|nr:PaaI family thioesterase [Salinicola salarius]